MATSVEFIPSASERVRTRRWDRQSRKDYDTRQSVQTTDMSVQPLPNTTCGPLKPRKFPPDVPGTVGIAFGHRLKERDCKLEKSRISVFETSARQSPEDKREYDRLEKSFEFERETRRRFCKKSIRQRVEQGMAAYEETLNERREKLRDLVLREEIDLTRQVIDQAQRGDDSRLEEMRERAEKLRAEQEEERLALVSAKRMQQYLARCIDVRGKLSKKRAIEAKSCNLVQMADREERMRAERKLDAMWFELMMKEVEVKERAEREIEEKRRQADREQAESVARQIEGRLVFGEERKKKLAEERAELERLWESVRQAEMRELEEERTKRARLKKELEEQIAVAQRFLVERARREEEMDRMMRTMAEEELAKESSAIRESAAVMRRELLAYLKYLEELREEEARRNMEVDAIVEQSYKDAQARRDLAVRKFKEARQRALQEVLRGREEQLREKRDAEERERKAREEEKAVVEKEIEQERRLIEIEKKESWRSVLRYRQDLEGQRKYAEELRKRQKEEEMRMYRAGLKQEEEYQRLTEELLNASENITPHPFKILLKEFAARQEAEKEGRLYCPPPLPAD